MGEVVQSGVLVRTAMGTYTFEHGGVSIHDPLTSECSRVRYEPGIDGGHTPEVYGFEVVKSDGMRLSAWERRFTIGSAKVVMQVTDASGQTHAVAPGDRARFEVSVVTEGQEERPLAVWYQEFGDLDERPPQVVFAAPEDPSGVSESLKAAACPNCGEPVLGHAETGCVLNQLVHVMRERQSVSEGRALELHAGCDADSLWNTLGKVVDSLEDGRYL